MIHPTIISNRSLHISQIKAYNHIYFYRRVCGSGYKYFKSVSIYSLCLELNPHLHLGTNSDPYSYLLASLAQPDPINN